VKFKININILHYVHVITALLYTSKQIFKSAEMLFTETKIENDKYGRGDNCYSKIKYLYHFINIEKDTFQTYSQK